MAPKISLFRGSVKLGFDFGKVLSDTSLFKSRKKAGVGLSD